MPSNGIIILAAGNASRMGKPKQLLSFKNKTFIQHIIEEALRTEIRPVIAVLGAYAEIIQPSIAHLPVHITVNGLWQTGMAGSVQAGLNALLQLHPETETVFISVADQPHISAELFFRMKEEKESSGKGIVACKYADTTGTPVLFSKEYFPALLNLAGQEGAKKIIKQHSEDVATVSFDLGFIDIDTEQDYKDFINAVG